MNNLKIAIRSLREMHRLEKRLLPCTAANAVTAAFLPFINIIFSSKIIDALENSAPVKTLIILIASAVLLNFVLAITSNFTNNVYYSYRWQMYNKEKQAIADKLFTLDYETLESSDFKELLHKHTEAQDRVFSAFTQFAWMTKDFITGLIMLVISVVTLVPLFKIGFTKTGDSFFERPLFLIIIIACVAIMAVVILLISTKMNKMWFETNDEYSKLDRFFMYFLKMFENYSTGKEIRLYKEQSMIRHSATDTLLTDGEKLLRKTSARSAATSSTIALLGAVLGFGIYLFIGVKGLFGLLSTASLVLYCGTFMQVIAAVIKIATTFGKTAEMCPLAQYYFDITGTQSKMKYGNSDLNDNKYDIEFKNVSFKYPGSETYALKNINFDVKTGEFVSIIGPSGCGKSTLLSIIAGLENKTEGEIYIDGKLGYMLQKDNLLEWRTIYKNVLLGLEIKKTLTEENKNYVLELLKKYGLYEFKDKYPMQLSGGMRQRVALIRTLAIRPNILLLDEAFSALDYQTRLMVTEDIYKILKQEGITAIMVTHDISEAISMSDRVIVLSNRPATVKNIYTIEGVFIGIVVICSAIFIYSVINISVVERKRYFGVYSIDSRC